MRIKVRINGTKIPQSIQSFQASGLHELLLLNVSKLQNKTPTELQKYVLPIFLHRRDITVCAPEGSGKTVSIQIVY